MKYTTEGVETRPYRLQARAISAAETEARIYTAANAAFISQPFDKVTLDEIARQAQVRVPTILRRFETKEHLFVLCIQHLMRLSQQVRSEASADTLRDIAILVVDHFEQQGPLILHFLNQEAHISAIHVIVDEGRQYHRNWIMELIAPLLPPLDTGARERLMVQVYALTDVRFWQTLRHALNQTRAETEQALFELLEGAISTAQRDNV